MNHARKIECHPGQVLNHSGKMECHGGKNVNHAGKIECQGGQVVNHTGKMECHGGFFFLSTYSQPGPSLIIYLYSIHGKNEFITVETRMSRWNNSMTKRKN